MTEHEEEIAAMILQRYGESLIDDLDFDFSPYARLSPDHRRSLYRGRAKAWLGLYPQLGRELVADLGSWP